MFTDIVGYTALTQLNEIRALEVLERHNRLVAPFFARYGGKTIKSMGDSFLVEFDSALNASLCAMEVQKFLHDYNTSSKDDWKIRIRIGIHLGDVIQKETDILGDAVNIASRIEPLADPEGVCITEQVYYQIVNKVDYSFHRLDHPELKNVTSSTNVYSIIMPWQTSYPATFSADAIDKKRIAVLPFANMSPDASDEYFADGMTEELIASLSGLRGIVPIARTSVMKYKSSSKGAAEIGRELNAGTLIEGSVRKIGKRVRVTAQLIDAASESQLWAQNYDRQLDDIFAIQSEIAERVAKELRIHLLESDKRRLETKPTSDAEAYTLYLRARYHWSHRTPEGVQAAIRYFNEAIKRDPDYTLALVGLADAYSTSAIFGYARPRDVFPKAWELVQRALDTDADSAEAHASIAEILMHYSYDWARAVRELERALQIKPNYVTAQMWRSSCYAFFGQMDQAVVQARRALELDPLSVVTMNELAKNLYYARRYDEAIRQFVASLEVEPDSAYLHKGLAETYVQVSNFEDALGEIEKALALSNRSPFILDAASAVYALANERRKAQEILSELEGLAKKMTFVPFYGRAAANGILGDKVNALRLLNLAYEERSWLAWLNVDPIFDALREEDAFRSLLQKMNLVTNPV